MLNLQPLQPQLGPFGHFLRTETEDENDEFELKGELLCVPFEFQKPHFVVVDVF